MNTARRANHIWKDNTKKKLNVVQQGGVRFCITKRNFGPVNQNNFGWSSDVPRNFFRGGVQQIQLRTEDKENGGLGGAVAP